jgi:hypothetical protein
VAGIVRLPRTAENTRSGVRDGQRVADFERARSVLASPRYARPAKGSLTTIAKHLERIYEKLGVESRTAAAMRAMRG